MWHVWQSFSFDNLPNLPWQVEIFGSFAAGDKKFLYWEPDHQMVLALYKNCHDQHDILVIQKAPWHMTSELN